MTFTTTITPSLFVLASLAAIFFGAGYAYALNHRLKWLADRATEISVLIGVAGTLIISLLVSHFYAFIVMLWLFACTGFFQFVRSAYNREIERAQGKQRLKEVLNTIPKGIPSDGATQTTSRSRNGTG